MGHIWAGILGRNTLLRDRSRTPGGMGDPPFMPFAHRNCQITHRSIFRISQISHHVLLRDLAAFSGVSQSSLASSLG